MTNNANLPPLPAKRYFTLDEVCQLTDIHPDQFRQWLQNEGNTVGYGGDTYTRQDVIRLRRLSGSFPAYLDPFNLNGLDQQGAPAANAAEVKAGLEKILANIESALAKA